MKGVILSRFPEARIVDLAHDIPAQWPPEAGFWVSRSYSWFPAGTVHMAIVDPGVGTEREILLVEADGHVFIAPDNGLLGQLLDSSESPRVFRLLPDKSNALRLLNRGFQRTCCRHRRSSDRHVADLRARQARRPAGARKFVWRHRNCESGRQRRRRTGLSPRRTASCKRRLYDLILLLHRLFLELGPGIAQRDDAVDDSRSCRVLFLIRTEVAQALELHGLSCR